jgi:hypothetical protein
VKSFLIGLLVFIVYAVICLFSIEYLLPGLEMELIKTDSITETAQIESSTSDSGVEPEMSDRKQSISTDSLNSNLQIVDITAATDTEEIDDVIEAERPESPSLPEANDDTSDTSPALFNVTLPDGTNLLECNQYSTVYKNTAKVKIPYSCREYGLAIQRFLEENPTTILKITALYDDSENREVGTARSQYLKKLLGNTGISKERIITTTAYSNLDIDKGYAQGGVLFEINGAVNNTKENLQVDQNSNAKSSNAAASKVIDSRTFTSGFQGYYYYGDQKFTAYISEMKRFLSRNPNSKIYAYNYTGTDGDDRGNFAITRDNASTVRKLLLQAGIPSSKIQSIARGERSGSADQPRLTVVIK